MRVRVCFCVFRVLLVTFLAVFRYQEEPNKVRLFRPAIRQWIRPLASELRCMGMGRKANDATTYEAKELTLPVHARDGCCLVIAPGQSPFWTQFVCIEM